MICSVLCYIGQPIFIKMDDNEYKEMYNGVCNNYENMMKVYSEGLILKNEELLDIYLEELNKFTQSIQPIVKFIFDGYNIPLCEVKKEPLDITNSLLWNLSRLDIIYHKCKAKLKLLNGMTLENVLK